MDDATTPSHGAQPERSVPQRPEHLRAGMSRRDFLRSSQAATGALATASLFATGCSSSGDDVVGAPGGPVLPPGVGAPTPSNLAVGLSASTELFQDTIYAQAVVSPNEPNTHALIEGPRGRPRVQSDLSADTPAELAYLETHYHFGHPELIQLEQVDGQWELAHYRHPSNESVDAARTTGLVREVIMDQSDGLASPTKIIAVTGTYTNRVQPGGGNQVCGMTYAVFVEQSNGHHYLAVGVGAATMTPPYDQEPVNPLRWESKRISSFGMSGLGDLMSSDKHTSAAWTSDLDTGDVAQYDPRQAVEHIILYYANDIVIVTLEDVGDIGLTGLGVARVKYPNPNVTDARVVHIDWDPTAANTSDWRRLQNIVVTQTFQYSQGNITYATFAVNRAGHSTSDGQHFFAANIGYTVVNYDGFVSEYVVGVSASDVQANPDIVVDYSTLTSVHGLYDIVVGGKYYHVKAGNFAGRGVFLFTVSKDGPPSTSTDDQPFYLQGHFPLKLPDANGLGTILNFSGGTSKFGGMRLLACDANGNLFLSRQRGAAPQADSPYEPPIYGLYDDTGAPLTTMNASPDALPSGVTASSNLHDLAMWVERSNTPENADYAYNLLLQAALALSTDEKGQAQGVWLGSGFQGGYATKRFGMDSEHVAIREVQTSGGTTQYSALAVFKNPVDKSWRQRLIATQVEPKAPGLNETGDHYQATITPVNSDGKPVSIASSVNSNLVIEVRADAPCTVTDDTHNLYYDIDRYTSFFAAPDLSSGRLDLVVKAESFSQVLYVRLIDSTQLQKHASDNALLTGSPEIASPWIAVNMAAQAQQRMGNTDSSSSAESVDGAPPDTTVYVSNETLAKSNTDNNWQTKGNYTASNSNLADLATYLNQSGSNMFAVTGQLLDPNDDTTIDPLTSTSAIPVDATRPTITTHFDYKGGSVTTTQSAAVAAVFAGAPGGVFHSISHALHDALHWLQHVEGNVYHELANDGVQIASDVNGVVVTISGDIMKQVNGVEADLEQVVSTVEEYANVVVNTMVTIVEESFIYQFVELMIALISMFIYFEDVLSLKHSFKKFFDDAYDNGTLPTLPADFDSGAVLSPLLGPTSTLASSMGSVDSSGVTTDVVTGIVDLISANPLSKKILNKVLSAISDPLLDPLSFGTDQTALAPLAQQVAQLETSLVQGLEAIAVDTFEALADSLETAATNPREFYNSLASDLGPVAEEIVPDVLTPIYDFIDSVVTSSPDALKAVLDYDAYVTLKIPMLADLCKLFGIGNTSGSNLKLTGDEAVFFPLAMIVWVAVYERTGKSISSINGLTGAQSVELGASKYTVWAYARSCADAVLTELGGLIWAEGALTDTTSDSGQSFAAKLTAAGSWVNLMRWVNEMLYTSYYWDEATGNPYDLANTFLRSSTACIDVYATLPGQNNNEGIGWAGSLKPTDITQGINVLATLGVMGYDSYETSSTSTDSIVNIVGQDIARSQIVAKGLYNVLQKPASLTEVVGAWVMFAPFGFTMQEAVS